MAVHLKSTTSFAYDETITETAFSTFGEEPMLMPVLYNVRPSQSSQEVAASFGTLGDYELKLEGAEMSEDNITQQFKKTFVHKAYAKLIRLSQELIDDDQVGFARDAGEQLGAKAAITMERRGASLFNDAFAGATYTGEDSLPLASAAHVNVDAGNSQDNSDTQTLNAAGLKTSMIAHRKMFGYRDTDEIIFVNTDELLVPVDLEEDAYVLMQSAGKPGGANNDVNMYAGRLTTYVWRYLTDTNAWFLMDSRRRKSSLRWYQRTPLEIVADASFTQKVRKIGGYMRYENGFTDWRWAYCNNPS